MSLSTYVYLFAAILPAIVLLLMIYRQDKIERESTSLLLKLVFGGVLSALVALVLESIFGGILQNVYFSSVVTATIANAIMIGLSEEFAKMLFLKKYSWNSPEFNYMFDGIVYAVAVSLGFAAFENIFYVFQYGLSVAVSRALLAVPAHTAFAIYMGSFYGKAKYCDVYGQKKACRMNLLWGFLFAAGLHAFYDACALLGSDTAMLIFAAFVIIMYIIVIRKVRKESREDQAF